MSLFTDAVAAELALIVPVAHIAPADLGYGTDISCVDDITDRADDVSGLPLLAQDIYHWLITQAGSLPGDSAEERSWGLGMPLALHRGMQARDLATLESRIQAGLEEDDRITQVAATVGYGNGTLEIKIRVTPADSSGPFELIVYVAADGSTQLELA